MKKRLRKKKTVRPQTDETDKTMKIAICIFLVVATLAVYWQIQDHEFLYFDDNQYVTDNLNVQVFVIAHRLSTVQKADQILVLDGGRVVERGNHVALLESGGLYSRLYEMQFADDGTLEPESSMPR